MRSSFALILAGLVACGEQKFTAVNAEPDVDVTSHDNGDEVGEGQATLFLAVIDDADDPEEDTVATWSAGERVVCERSAVTTWGESMCEMRLAMRETEVSIFVEDPRGSTGGDVVHLDVLATDAPVVDILSPLTTERYYSDHPVLMEALASDSEDFVEDLSVEWVGEEAGNLEVPEAPDSDGKIQAYVSLAEGTHNLRVMVTDTTDKTGEDIVQIEVSGPNRAPSCGWLAPDEGTVLTLDEPVTLSGEATDPDVNSDRLEVHWSSDRDGSLGSSTPTSEGIVSLIASGLSRDDHILTMTAVDEVGASCTAERGVVVTTGPEVVINKPVGDDLYYSNYPVDLEGSLTDAEDGPDALSAQWESDVDGVLDVASDVASDGLNSGAAWLVEGVHILTLTGTDGDGVTGTDSSTITVRGLNQAPTCLVTGPPSGSGGDEGAVITLTGEVDDADIGPEALTVVWISNLEGTPIGTSTPSSDGSVSLGIGTLAAGTHVLSMTVTDEVGASCVDDTIFVVGQAPVVAITAPSDGTTVNQGVTVTFVGSISDEDDAVSTLAVTWISDRDGLLHEVSPDSSGLSIVTAGSLTVGTHTITLTATDSLGLYSTDVVVLTVNGLPTAPVIQITPDLATTLDTLGVDILVDSVDPEGAPITYRHEWFLAEAIVGEAGTVAPELTAKGQAWQVRVTPTDGTGEGAPGTADRVILNSVPVIHAAEIGPDPLVTNSVATTILTVTDPDGDELTHSHAWAVDGAPVGDVSGSLDGLLYFDKHQLVSVQVTPSDEESTGEPIDATPVFVQNAPPTAPTIVLVPDETMGAVDDLWCRVLENGTDADGDEVLNAVAWERDDYPYPDDAPEDSGGGWLGPLTDEWTGDTVPSEDTRIEEVWRCTVTSWDDEEAGGSAEASIEIQPPPPGCGDGILQPGEEVDPPVSPFTHLHINPETCRWDFSEVEQLYCYGMCSWDGPFGCDDADADVLCRLIMDNPDSEALSYAVIAPLSEPGFPGVYCGYGTTIATDRGVPDVSWMDASVAAHHGGGGTVVAFPDCTNP
jgi:hypothetical protein